MIPTQSDNSPYISVIITARNDNHGGNMLGRMQASLESWMEQARQYELPSEIVVVEWNPPSERPRLIDDLRWPSDPGPCRVRFIEVSPELHLSFPNAPAIPLHQMIAKNVGIRRARGRFILATNLDIVFSPELMRFLAERRLEEGVMYRMDRHDVASDIPCGAPLQKLLGFCQSSILRVFARGGSFDLDAEGLRTPEARDILSADSGIRLGDGWCAPESDSREWFRWVEAEAQIVFLRPEGTPPRLLLDAEVGPSAEPGPLPLDIVDADGRLLASTELRGRGVWRLTMTPDVVAGRVRLHVHGHTIPLRHDPRLLNLRLYGLRWETASSGVPESGAWALDELHSAPGSNWIGSGEEPSPAAAFMRRSRYLHTNACGDFTLLARNHWFDLRAYPEFPIWPMHIDSLFCYAAHHAGIREEILRPPLRIFHIQHLSGAGWTPEGQEELAARVARKKVSTIGYAEVVRWINQMRRFDAPMIFSPSTWGLADVELPETTPPHETARR